MILQQRKRGCGVRHQNIAETELDGVKNSADFALGDSNKDGAGNVFQLVNIYGDHICSPLISKDGSVRQIILEQDIARDSVIITYRRDGIFGWSNSKDGGIHPLPIAV